MSPKKTLSGRTFLLVFLFSVIIMIATMLAATSASFSAYEEETTDSLIVQANAYAAELREDETEEAMCATLEGLAIADIRCTLIASDGRVLYDNRIDPATLDNHANRKEVLGAKSQGEAVVVSRHSDTIDDDTLYVAKSIKDGIVLRVSDTHPSLASFISGLSKQLLFSLFVVFLLSLCISRLLTHMIVKPLRDVDLSKPLENEVYAELQPLLQRVDTQRIELESQNKKLEHAYEMRREFTGNVSHEMKSPLQVIGGYAELMESGMVSAEDVPRFAKLIHNEAVAMRELIDDVLTLSRLDEKVNEETVKISLLDLSLRVKTRLQSAADLRGIAIDVHVPKSCYVAGSLSQMEQMVYNLVNNAIKYNKDQGRVAVSAYTHAGVVSLSVADEGPGVPEEYKQRIFERFYRVDASRSRETGGTGLGLAIVKHAAEAMGGRVYVQDSYLGGANFIVEMPAA